MRIGNAKLRRRIVDLVEQIAGEDERLAHAAGAGSATPTLPMYARPRLDPAG